MSILIAVTMIISLFTIIPFTSASAAEGDEILVAKIEAWVKGIAYPDHDGYYYFSKSKL